MTKSDKRVPLRDVEPIGPAEDGAPEIESLEDADRIGRTAAAVMGSTPAVGVTLETIDEPAPPDDDDLERLRRA